MSETRIIKARRNRQRKEPLVPGEDRDLGARVRELIDENDDARETAGSEQWQPGDIVTESQATETDRDAIEALLKDIAWDNLSAAETAGKTGAEAIAIYVKQLPNRPGVYRMLNKGGDVLYVGKARSLKKRVSNYAQGRAHAGRLTRMIAETHSMDFIVTRTETEALLLEANLIKRLRPRFNVLLRDDKSFPYIVLTTDHSAPGIFKHRGARSKHRDYYGPFASAGAVTRTVNSLQKAFLIRSCSDSVYASRTRPCLLYQIKRCAGPCTGEVSEDDYRKLVRDAGDFLSGRSNAVTKRMADEMNAAAENLDFERAALFRDRLSSLSHVQSHQGINVQGVEEADIFAIHQEGGQNCIEVFFFRTGQNWGNRAYFPKADSALEEGDVLGAFLSQFYDDKPVPRQILLSHSVEDQNLLAEALCVKASRKVTIAVPARGEKRDLVGRALQNAREALGRRLAETSAQSKLLAGLAATFGLDEPPRRIEVFDNSHIMGTNAVGAMIVAGPDGFAKNSYRKFNIKNPDTNPGDDFAMMREVMQRRFARLLKEQGKPSETAAGDSPQKDEDSFPDWPDLLLIDGGRGQISSVMEILRQLGVEKEVAVIGVAKGQDRDAGRERFVIEGRSEFSLPPRDPVLYFIQRLRDEAHRFAIGSHRAKRKANFTKNPLDEIGGIGPSRKRALLQHFGTAKAVSRAALRDLMAVEGISESIARQIYDHFHEGGDGG
ncbi:excinuclease ABC subunit UvrC [Notoacmeibacter sp. MSK16QG-6]|uniref:excinuclease ABC subunit UvrC n=1 Tax=Notoacmeibacter sp. MSK16QG-6 TaxID=2957982 RepID=UPI0020A136E6|nr:excinuclease ABC subunit UvrC [Notoacmeibacter sp. MSK16QG-6]MCP1197962.1 excinuclease ABC subunit UvrC [Notoacmeibacter sp. MSK16QG-6]